MDRLCRGGGGVYRRWLPGITRAQRFWYSSQRLRDFAFSVDFRPSNRWRTLMSSSRSGQWMPSPSAMSRLLPLSSGVALANLGDQAIGTDRLRPSINSSVSWLLVILTAVARATAASTAESVIPCSHELIPPLLYDTRDSVDFHRPEISAVRNHHRIQPEPGFQVFPFHVNVRPFNSVAHIEEEPVRPLSMYDWHPAAAPEAWPFRYGGVGVIPFGCTMEIKVPAFAGMTGGFSGVG